MTESVTRHKPTILVVEDEALIRMDLIETIREEGYEAYEAGTAEEAIKLMERHPEIRVLLTDVEMPGSMDGLKLSHYVRDRWPPVRIIVVSGQVRLTPTQLPAGSIFLQKPYAIPALQRALQSAIGQDQQ